MVAQIFAFEPRQGVISDWSQSELAELYRIQNALVQSGLCVEHDRGLTDEGDPWFVFCRPDGEVLVHLTRFDGLYRLHSSALPTPLVGRSFVELTKAFADRIPLQVAVQRAKGARLYVHPASMLAIIVSTIFLAAQDVLPLQGTAEASKKGHDGGEAAAAHPLKTALQAMFQSHIDAIIGWIEEGGSAQQTTYFGLIGTVAAVLTGLADALVQDFGGAKADAEQLAQSTNAHQTHDDVAAAAANNVTGHDSATEQTKLSALTQVPDQSAQQAQGHQTPGDQAITGAIQTHSGSSDVAVSDAERSATARQADTGSMFYSDHSVSIPDGSISDLGVSHWLTAVQLKSSPEVPAASLSPSTLSVYSSTVANDLLSSLNLVSPSNGGVQNGWAEVNALLAHALAFDSSNNPGLSVLASTNAAAAPTPQLFDAQAAIQLDTFLKDNPTAQAVFNNHSIVIYETNSTSHASDSVLNIWKFADGSTITLVGVSDHHGTLV